MQDPKTMRAIAHPARTRILERLVLGGPMTATDCSGATGLSPSACSYHLRVLGQAGLVEEVPEVEDHRRRPWRATFTSLAVGTPAGTPLSPGEASAELAVIRQIIAHSDRMALAYFEQEQQEETGWRQAAGLEQTVLDVTADELRSLRNRLVQLLQPYSVQGRPAGPLHHLRPGSRLVNVDVRLTPILDPGALAPDTTT
ncbi:MAG: ArsR/SmtB family transcription factor [Candidatus Dormibacteria bacterium]